MEVVSVSVKAVRVRVYGLGVSDFWIVLGG